MLVALAAYRLSTSGDPVTLSSVVEGAGHGVASVVIIVLAAAATSVGSLAVLAILVTSAATLALRHNRRRVSP